ncbi:MULTISPECIES: hypothetical protein [Citrobacter]|uniref:hypothetical protein n=1 Tax=Citrobacter TaxID=544 RepID=UPI002576DCA9|nr:hypothetical protein [Citrobacter sp. CK195]HDQ2605630.1 hypothetical protein [Citrobacter koseri]MDM2993396.1 hypothetical protein [Citrobacter sp. CK195]HDS4828604.1 hypothetical protein [Citrobacter koseri]HDW1087278.1 hypothetical protein [Citrobacter koseri]HDZ7987300.1 hypothetical protein [Citrobacter koseri]
MSVKRYDITGEMDGNCQLNEARMECTDDGIFVRYADYAALEQQLAESHRALRAETTAHENTQMQLEKMAAENAGLKKFCKDAAFDADYEAELGMERGGFTDGLSLVKTQSTDAFLAKVRAHDLNAFIQHHSAELDAHIKNGGEQFDEKSVRIRDIIVSARLFREQIRKGGAA